MSIKQTLVPTFNFNLTLSFLSLFKFNLIILIVIKCVKIHKMCKYLWVILYIPFSPNLKFVKVIETIQSIIFDI